MSHSTENPAAGEDDLLQAAKLLMQVITKQRIRRVDFTTYSDLLDWFVEQVDTANIGRQVSDALFTELLAIGAVVKHKGYYSIVSTRLVGSRFGESAKQERDAHLGLFPWVKHKIYRHKIDRRPK